MNGSSARLPVAPEKSGILSKTDGKVNSNPKPGDKNEFSMGSSKTHPMLTES
ncbi:hypothetical protein [Desulfosarcina cetonica]|uniref:hypothetical protein n=1 Tax=Desulfosarcina cetonica TaxID=90730 RepID=UPI0012ED3AE8|nr:hypothetical protein [Desulfosarcina cetonica]